MAFLNIVNPNQTCELPSPMAINYNFALDPFQKHAINAIAKDEIVGLIDTFSGIQYLKNGNIKDLHWPQ
jgi:hypothetical protein